MKSKLIAHRGFSGKYPENSMLAFKKAIEHKAQMIEFDVHMSLDEKIMVIHDDEISRTTGVHGQVNKMKSDELTKISINKKFAPNFSEEKIPLLDDVFELILPKIELNVEIKTFDGAGTDYKIKMISALEKTIKNKEMLGRILFSSFDTEVLKLAAEKNPHWKLALISDLKDGVLPKILDEQKFYSFHPDYHKLNSQMMSDLKKRNLRVYTWTVNDPSLIEKLEDMGVDGIITNEVEDFYSKIP